jgi:hypothetical protein
MRLNRRRLPGRRFARPGRPALPASPPPLELPAEDARSGESTEFAIASVPAEPPPSTAKTHDTTVELPSVVPVIEEGGAPAEEPIPPDRLKFSCPCGAELLATVATYDTRSRCGTCQAVLLLNVVYDPETGMHEIVPFEVNP